ncbi:isocitrate/isopropylmalate dehydrogenase family protein [Halorhodospira halochloris]|uniref:Tartrate dehydrogenase n=1 Tax=Halorhodospira halochloris TaxID=1052 RepID=A0A0X8XBV7_HALHR|nr:isocitrate/isopropylmalate family dehydrogenase [Halorhodospira halochloris]MBK1652784.1 3-isopropylmalate dehydrogenase [Halorhodospira halochloris]MCG5530797.1 isocitrate/isopropylmalate dehydrogenase family protein [Halorhodospira halochloris]BAU58907.1 tartrate dehydrogenase [Halorhodospira halochloris]
MNKSDQQWRVAVMPGDGIGPEVMAATCRALESLPNLELELEELPWPSHDWHRDQDEMMPADWRDKLSGYDALLLGALGDPGPVTDPNRYYLPDGVSLQPLLEIRKGLDLWACERPAVPMVGAPQYLADPRALETDLLVIRENSEGEYVDQGGRLGVGSERETATQLEVFTRTATRRIIRHAFDRAEQRRRDRQRGLRPLKSFPYGAEQSAQASASVCVVTKRNAVRYSGELWCDVFAEVAADYPHIHTQHELVDACCMKMVTQPWAFDVVVASNLHGDILTDLAAVLAGGMGVAPSANLNPDDREVPPLFEPTHGSAPDIAGSDRAHPAAMLLTAATMLEWMGESDDAAAEAAALLRKAVADDLAEKGMSGRSCTQVGEEIAQRLANTHI